MVRTLQEIVSGIKSEFVANSVLQDIYDLDPEKSFDDQFSTASLEAVIIFLFSASVWALEKLWDIFSTEIDQRISNAYLASRGWYHQKALAFQLGDNLVYNDKTYSFGYEAIDSNKQVVKNVAIRQVTDEGVTKLKVYYSDKDKQPLTGDVRVAFEQYMFEIGAAGTHYLFVSESPDPLRVHLRIYYDPLVIDSAGTRLSGGGKPVEEAINKYLNSLDYGGIFYASRLVDMIQATEGVLDVTLDGTTWSGSMEDRRRIDSISGAFRYEAITGDILYQID